MSPGVLRAARLKMGMTQDGLADALGFESATRYQTIWAYEAGRRPIPRRVAVAVNLLLKDWERPTK